MVAMWWCYWSDAPCIRHAPYCDVQDANEMRTVENAKRNETYGTETRDIRDDSYFKKTPPLGMGGGGILFCLSKVGRVHCQMTTYTDIHAANTKNSQFSVVSVE